MEGFIIPAAQLGSTVFVTVAFLFYLSRRDNDVALSLKSSSESNIVLARALQKLTDMVERNSSANVKNTDAVKENVVAVGENTEVIKKSNGKSV